MESMFLEVAVREREMERRLLEAAIYGNTMELQQLLQEDWSILDREMIKCEKEKKDNPLHIAALYGHVYFIKEMLSLKWGFTRQLNSQGHSPLHLATARGQVEVVKEILNADPGACFVRGRDGMIPLHLAAIKGRLDVLETLVNANKRTAFVLTEIGEPLLHLCAKNNKIKALKKLLELVQDDEFLKLKDSDDNTILHVLSHKSQTEVIWVIRLLLKQNVVDINAENKDGLTPMQFSLEYSSGFGIGRYIILFLLYKYGRMTKRGRRLVPRPLELETTSDVTGIDRSWFAEVLLVVAVLTVTVAFQAGINPPGGVWQDTKVENGTLHYAGQSIMAVMDPKRFRDFSMFTYVTLVLSLLAILMLLSGWQSFSIIWIFKVLPIILTSISVCTMVASYTVSISFLSPDASFKSSPGQTYWIVGLLLATIIFMANSVRIYQLSFLVLGWFHKKLHSNT